MITSEERIEGERDLGRLVRAARKRAGISQQELADLASMSRRPIYLLESGRGTVRLDTLCQILNALGLEIRIGVRRVEP